MIDITLVPFACQGRLTLESGVAISTSDQTAKTTIYFTPYGGNRVTIYNGSAWRLYAFTEISLALGTLTSGKNYDVFIYDNAGTLTLELAAAWTNDTTRADAITLQDGVHVKSGASTRLHLGTIRTTSTTTTETSEAKRFVWNRFNQVPLRATRRSVVSNQTTTSSSFATLHSSFDCELVVGDACMADAAVSVVIVNGSAAVSDVSIAAQPNSGSDYVIFSDCVDSNTIYKPLAGSRQIPLVAGYNAVHLRWARTAGLGTTTYNGASRGGVSNGSQFSTTTLM